MYPPMYTPYLVLMTGSSHYVPLQYNSTYIAPSPLMASFGLYVRS